MVIIGHILFIDGNKGGKSLILQPDGTWDNGFFPSPKDNKRSRACAVSYSPNKVAIIGGSRPPAPVSVKFVISMHNNLNP